MIELEIQENVVGAVIGPAGRSIIDLQQYSGARIQVSKKGFFSPGTRNRIVSISGPPQSIGTLRIKLKKNHVLKMYNQFTTLINLLFFSL